MSRNRIVAGENGIDLPRFSFREAGMLQSFPEKYPWSGKDVSQQIGNAVPPRLGLHILSAAMGLGRPSEEAIKRLEQWRPQTSSDALSARPRTLASSKSSEK